MNAAENGGLVFLSDELSVCDKIDDQEVKVFGFENNSWWGGVVGSLVCFFG